MFTRFKIFISILICVGTLPAGAIIGDIKIAAIRVEFPNDENEGTSGKGKFLLESFAGQCGKYTVDPPPHDKSYFESQLRAVDNYYRVASKQNFGIDLTNSQIFPTSNNGSYLMPNEMGYYHPLADDLDEDERTILHEERIVELFNDAVTYAHQADNIDFSNFDVVVVFHAGISQDFNIDLDITPEDIPSSFIDKNMINTHIGNSGIYIGGYQIEQGIILPETQNHIFYDEFVDQVQQSSGVDICQYQYGLTGTFAMMIGQAIGLPPLWNTVSGLSGIGVFGLMDQGSNNGRGLIPALPTAWTRIFAGWDNSEVVMLEEATQVVSQPNGGILRVDLNDEEYFLIENRTNWFRDNINLDSAQFAVYNQIDTIPNVINFIFDSLGAEVDDNGVIVGIPDYDIGLPGSGLLIWHIDEGIIDNNFNSNSINNNPNYKGIDLEEAGGPQDIGYVSTALFRDPSIGEPYDMWYVGNLEYEEINPTKADFINFGPYTFPDTRSNSGARSFLTIDHIGRASDTMDILISNSITLPDFHDNTASVLYFTDFNGDGSAEQIGGENILWWRNIDNSEKTEFYTLPSEKNYFTITNTDNRKKLVIVSEIGDSLKYAWFEFENDFLLTKELTIKNDFSAIDHLVGSTESEHVYNSYRHDRIDLVNTANGEHGVASYWDTGGIALYNKSELYNNTIFKYISAIDLDIDGNIEVLTVDANGKVFAFDKYGNYASGFPIDGEAVAPILAKNIIGDEQPEVIFKELSGDIVIVNSVGELQYRLSSPQSSQLIMLGEHEGKNTIVTQSEVWSFDGISKNGGNEWTSYYGNEINSQTIKIDYYIEPNSDGKLIDKKKTYVYPNPIKTDRAKIRVYNYSASHVDIKIYDAAGFLVDTIHDEFDVFNGAWETLWDVSDVESGIYLIKLDVSLNGKIESTILKVSVIH